MKRVLSLVLALVMVLGMIPMGFAADQTAGEILKGYNLLAGDENGNLNEDQYLNRAEMMVILARMNGKFEEAKSFALPSSYTDLEGFGWAVPYIAYAEMNEWTDGVAPGKFDPAGRVTLQMAAYFMVEALGYADPADFSWATAVEKATSLGLLAGVQANAGDNVLRGQLFKVMLQTLNTNVKDGSATLGVKLGVMKPAVPVAVSATSVSKSVVRVTFNNNIGTATVKDFNVYEKNDVDDIKVVDSVSISNNVVSVKLINTLSEDTEYVIEVNNVKDTNGVAMAEKATLNFKYVPTKPATISFASTTVENGKDVKFVIRDANGNDITGNYSVSDLTVETSNSIAVSELLKASTESDRDYSVVNLILEIEDEDVKIQTGNTIIFVKERVDVLTSVGRVTIDKKGDLDPSFSKPDMTIAKDEEGQTLFAEALNQDGKVIKTGITTEFRSNNPTILVVDKETGDLTAVATGSATVVITMIDDNNDDKKVSKAVTITVQKAAEATSIKLEPTTVKVVMGSQIEQTVKVTVLDQYGKAFKAAAGEFEARVSRKIELDVNTVELDPTEGWLATKYYTIPVNEDDFVDGEAEFTFTYNKDVDVSAKSATLTVRYTEAGEDTALPVKSLALSLVKKGTFAGYAVVADDLTLDLADDDYPKESIVEIYEKDVNGNYITRVALDRVSFDISDDDVVKVKTVNGKYVIYAAGDTGTSDVKVSVGTSVVATLKFTVVDSDPVLTTVEQLKTSVKVNAGEDLLGVFFGTVLVDGRLTDGDVFVGYDQYNDEVGFDVVDDEIELFSSNQSIVTNTGSTLTAGTAVVTVKINTTLYAVTVVVE